MWWTRAPYRMPFLTSAIFLTHSCAWIQFTWLNHVAVTGTATAAPAKRVDAGSSPARNSSSHISDRPGWQMRSLHPTENREEHARYVPQAPFSKTTQEHLWGQHKGADDPCKIVAAGALPAVSTSSPAVTCVTEADKAHVAQLDNAPDYGSGRWRFESFRARQSAFSLEQPCGTNCLRCRARLLRPENGPGPSPCQAAILSNSS
jgi:hypothetical protein